MSELLEKIKQRKFFYRDYFRYACTALWIAIGLVIVLTILDVYLYLTTPLPTFYATSSDGKLMPLQPLDSPNYSNTPLIQ